jgi:hypothetical protein
MARCTSPTHNQDKYVLYDARGIPCGYVCHVCEEQVASRYRPEVMSDSNYDADEEIEEDRW